MTDVRLMPGVPAPGHVHTGHQPHARQAPGWSSDRPPRVPQRVLRLESRICCFTTSSRCGWAKHRWLCRAVLQALLEQTYWHDRDRWGASHGAAGGSPSPPPSRLLSLWCFVTPTQPALLDPLIPRSALCQCESYDLDSVQGGGTWGGCGHRGVWPGGHVLPATRLGSSSAQDAAQLCGRRFLNTKGKRALSSWFLCFGPALAFCGPLVTAWCRVPSCGVDSAQPRGPPSRHLVICAHASPRSVPLCLSGSGDEGAPREWRERARTQRTAEAALGKPPPPQRSLLQGRQREGSHPVRGPRCPLQRWSLRPADRPISSHVVSKIPCAVDLADNEKMPVNPPGNVRQSKEKSSQTSEEMRAFREELWEENLKQHIQKTHKGRERFRGTAPLKEMSPAARDLEIKIEVEGKHRNSSYEASITLIPEQRRHKLQAGVSPEHRCENPQQNISKSNLTMYEKNYTP
ncbi:leucine-rich repeat-containing protein 27 isoform X3 [Herpailurus yagouaroundi]|uniref:leucine-rich repeat-containing protein 27 isoform X3 n=1 Tax=Herpailurus yagouaroundi TaxID=1608482 RepID=UPI001AD7330E|nr:leucine-rich repeat-containing protein 27 isoform X3 [Puma yagouaroundi]